MSQSSPEDNVPVAAPAAVEEVVAPVVAEETPVVEEQAPVVVEAPEATEEAVDPNRPKRRKRN